MVLSICLIALLTISLAAGNVESCDEQSEECSVGEEVSTKEYVEGQCTEEKWKEIREREMQLEKLEELLRVKEIEIARKQESLNRQLEELQTRVSAPQEEELSDSTNWDPCTAVKTIFKSVTLGTRRSFFIDSKVRYDINYYWVSYEGEEMLQGTVSALEIKVLTSFPGHVFRFRSAFDGRLISEQQLPLTEDEDSGIFVFPCGDPTKDTRLFGPGRDVEFESLVLDPTCEGDDSKYWSCVRHVSLEEEKNRVKSEYGFIAEEEINGNINNEVGKTTDDVYVKHLHQIPRMNEGPGWLLMNMTDLMRSTLLSWYATEKAKGKMEAHGDAGGRYSNSFIVPIEKLNLDYYPDVKLVVTRELQEIMQWWTRRQLKHSSTFGLRHYKRGSMLLNHVDRMDTHIASAVVQVAQENVDPNGGWPLEVILPLYCTKSELIGGEPGCHLGEVYMQPGQIVLYQSGILMHGRPMRFRGEGFGNIFTHFAPIDWFGPEVSVYTGKTKKKHRRYNKQNSL